MSDFFNIAFKTAIYSQFLRRKTDWTGIYNRQFSLVCSFGLFFKKSKSNGCSVFHGSLIC